MVAWCWLNFWTLICGFERFPKINWTPHKQIQTFYRHHHHHNIDTNQLANNQTNLTRKFHESWDLFSLSVIDCCRLPKSVVIVQRKAKEMAWTKHVAKKKHEQQHVAVEKRKINNKTKLNFGIQITNSHGPSPGEKQIRTWI